MNRAICSESGVLGLLMIHEEIAPDVFRSLTREMFYDDKNGKFFEHVKDMSITCAKLDPVSVRQSLRSAGIFGDLGGEDYLGPLLHDSVPLSNLDYHLSQIRKAFFARNMITCAQRLIDNTDNAQIVTELQRYAIAREAEDAPPYFNFATDLPKHMDLLEPDPDGQGIVDTGFSTLDASLQGLRKGDLFTISARPGGGKTAIMTKMAVNMAEAGLTVGYLSTEMTTEQFVNRVLPFKSKIDSWKFRKRNLDFQERSKITEACGDMHGKTNLVVSDISRPSLADIRAMIVRIKPSVLFIDYLQRCARPKAENYTRQVDEFMASLKSLCKDHKLVIILGCQMNRSFDKTKGEPTLSDLRDSGSIESESDQVMLLWMPEQQDESSNTRTINALLEKNRHGQQTALSFALNRNYVEVTEAQVYG